MIVLRTEQVRKYFGEVRAVDSVNLSLEKGVLTSVVGPNGAGKTTLVNLLSGLLAPDSGRIFFLDRDITRLPPSKRTRLGIGRCFQLVSLYEGLTAFDNIRIPVISAHGVAPNMISPLDGKELITKRTEEILGTFGLLEKKNTVAKDLPHGDKKILDIAVAYSLNPTLLLLDEPTSGVSTFEKTRVMQLIRDLIKSKGITALVVEHDMDVVYSYSDKIVVLHQGSILAEGSPKDVMENPQVAKVFLGVEK